MFHDPCHEFRMDIPSLFVGHGNVDMHTAAALAFERFRRKIRIGAVGHGNHLDHVLEGGRVVGCCQRLGKLEIDLMGLDETGMQPFSLSNDHIVCNGEIYGFRSLRDSLVKKGWHFKSGSDCEILLPLYREYGLDMFRMLDAEFAMSISLLYPHGLLS